MKKELLPYYLSRAVLSGLFAVLIMGLTWKAAPLAAILFGLFVLYLHSGWFQVDASHPLTPLHRDERGRQIQRKALIAAVTVGLLIYLSATLAIGFLDLPAVAGPLALSLGVFAYFITQFVLFARA
jgi:hypothetical protein